jgi:hypothetical protein
MGNSGESATEPNRRRTCDAAQLARARRETVVPLGKLLRLIRSPSPPSVALERQARETLRAVGLLWEAAARVNER